MSERSRILDPIDRLSEIIFGLLMALSFTGTMSSVAGGEGGVNAVLVAALGCNIAWGIVDGVMYVLTTVVERVRRRGFLDRLRHERLDRARELFLESLPDDVRRVSSPKETEALLVRVRALSPDPRHRVVTARDLKAAVAIFLLVVASTLPPSIPFLLTDVGLAMRASNAIALAMLFVIGARLGRYMGRSPWPMALAMTAIGAVLVAVTILFGG
ncbi:VIT1/CCC1 transporter family protein [Ensifer sp. PDNC004]|uniref:VIT1/CCC1 transporter family protein n=1 Tax=Ensifer sp. PDNC004 TaxID=2811423 RepID=UPI001964A393|nr:VIT1/CCC1 transporter family protein [Ensifer sp. PDNC004]QRY68715.1 VIT1/CCC1 transporter family protein [Ensifer sp. PDNC004]